MSMLSYQHFPIYAIMSLFLGAFLVVMLGKNRAVRNALAFISVSASLGFLLAACKARYDRRGGHRLLDGRQSSRGGLRHWYCP